MIINSFAHFDWFLSLFQISDVKPELLPVELKVCKNGIFWAKNLNQKKIPGYFCPPIKVMRKNRAKSMSIPEATYGRVKS